MTTQSELDEARRLRLSGRDVKLRDENGDVFETFQDLVVLASDHDRIVSSFQARAQELERALTRCLRAMDDTCKSGQMIADPGAYEAGQAVLYSAIQGEG